MKYVVDCRLDRLLFPEVLCTAMSRPAFSLRAIESRLVQPATRVRFVIIHGSFRLCIGLNYHVDMVGPNVDSE